MDTKDWDKEYDDLNRRELTILGRWFWFTVILTVALFLWSVGAYAAPILRADEQGVSIVLTDEPCKLEVVKNLPYRATWTEKGKKYEGCWADAGSVFVAYFDDKTVALLPVQIFRPISGA